MNLAVALGAGGAIGAISGAVTGCEVSAVVQNHDVACAPSGALAGAVVGALLAGITARSVFAAALSRRRGLAAAMLIFVLVAVGIGAWVAEWVSSEPGGDQVVLFAIGLGVVMAAAVSVGIGVGVGKRRPWALWLATVSFGLAIPASLAALLANAEVGSSLVAPAVFFGLSVGIVVLLSSPPLHRRHSVDRSEISSST